VYLLGHLPVLLKSVFNMYSIRPQNTYVFLMHCAGEGLDIFINILQHAEQMLIYSRCKIAYYQAQSLGAHAKLYVFA
jgi:hypothetical protein